MTLHTKGTKKIWAKLGVAAPEDKTKLYVKLFDKLVESADSARFSVGYSALDGLLAGESFEDATELGRRLSFELMGEAEYAEAAAVLETVLSHQLWVSSFETAMARWCLGTIMMKSGSLENADAEFECALSTFGENHDIHRACVEKERAECLSLLNRIDESMMSCARAISTFEECGSMDGVALAKKQMGELLVKQDRHQMAIKYLDDALELFQFLGWALASQQTQVLLGTACFLLGDFDTSREHLSFAQVNRSTKESQSVAAEASYQLICLDEAIQGEKSQIIEYGRLVPILRAAGLPELAHLAEMKAGL